MIPETDVGKLLELYKATNKQTDDILEIIRTVSDNNERIMNLVHQLTNIVELLSKENINQNDRIMNLEMQIRELKNANNLWTWSRN